MGSAALFLIRFSDYVTSLAHNNKQNACEYKNNTIKFEANHFDFYSSKLKMTHTNLIVPVGEGVGDVGVDLASGILILSDEKFFVAFGGLGTRRGTLSSNSEVNHILTFVEGNRSTHLKR